MSFESWKQEFYPRSAQEAADESKGAALAHSVQKWAGRLSHNREKHGVHQDHMNVFAHGKVEWVLCYDAESCALCERYLTRYGHCNDCPITKNTGIPCHSEDENGTPLVDEEGNLVRSHYNLTIVKPSDVNILKLIAAMTGETYDAVASRFLPPDGKSSISDEPTII